MLSSSIRKNEVSASVIHYSDCLGMVTRGLEKFDNDFAMSYHPERRQSILLSSHPKTVTRPIDCILVYNPMDDDHDEGVDHHKRHSKRRQRFETFLKEEHGLFLETEVGLDDENDENFTGDLPRNALHRTKKPSLKSTHRSEHCSTWLRRYE